MATKTCPSCSESVPAAAARCKHCFHNFNEAPPKKGFSLVSLMALLFVLASLGAATFAYVYYSQVQEKVVIDAETQSVVFSRTTTTKTTTERVAFSDIIKVEHARGTTPSTYEIVAITSKGDRHVIKQSGDGPLHGDGEHIATMMKKPYEDLTTTNALDD